MDQLPGFLDRAPDGAMDYLKNLYYDTALSTSPTAMAALIQLVDQPHILFGSDYPFFPAEGVEAEVLSLNTLPLLLKTNGCFGFNWPTLEKINRSNALSLFPRFDV